MAFIGIFLLFQWICKFPSLPHLLRKAQAATVKVYHQPWPLRHTPSRPDMRRYVIPEYHYLVSLFFLAWRPSLVSELCSSPMRSVNLILTYISDYIWSSWLVLRLPTLRPMLTRHYPWLVVSKITDREISQSFERWRCSLVSCWGWFETALPFFGWSVTIAVV